MTSSSTCCAGWPPPRRSWSPRGCRTPNRSCSWSWQCPAGLSRSCSWLCWCPAGLSRSCSWSWRCPAGLRIGCSSRTCWSSWRSPGCWWSWGWGCPAAPKTTCSWRWGYSAAPRRSSSWSTGIPDGVKSNYLVKQYSTNIFTTWELKIDKLIPSNHERFCWDDGKFAKIFYMDIYSFRNEKLWFFRSWNNEKFCQNDGKFCMNTKHLSIFTLSEMKIVNWSEKKWKNFVGIKLTCIS